MKHTSPPINRNVATTRSRATWVPLATLVSLLLIAASCEKKQPTAPLTSGSPAEASAGSDRTTSGSPSPAEAPLPDALYGVPLPPHSTGLQQFNQSAQLVTTSDQTTLLQWYQQYAHQFEIVEDGENLELVPLDSFLGNARFSRITNRPSPMMMIVWPNAAPTTPNKPDPDASPDTPKAHSPTDNIPGTPVLLTDDSGKLMAPGAIWGKHYIPPKGTYFHQEEFRANWGRPFGEWFPQ